MVVHPQSYPWSFWHANVGKRQSSLVTPHPEYVALGATDVEYQGNHRAWVLQDEQESMTTQLRNATQQNAAFGSPRFAYQIEQMRGRDVTVKPRGRPKKGP